MKYSDQQRIQRIYDNAVKLCEYMLNRETEDMEDG